MAEFNYTEYLRNNPLTNLKSTSKSTLTEGIDGDIKAALTSVGSDSEINQYMVSLKNSKDEFDGVEDYVEDFKNYIADKSLEEAPSTSRMKVSELKAKIKEDILSTLNEEDTTLEDELMSQLNEDEEEDVEVEIEDEVEGGGDADAIDPEAGLTQDEQDIQNALKVAFDSANAIGDEKLADQIGNTITMFTRTHVVNR